MVYSGLVGKREQTRAFIIEKTAPIFNRRGFIGTSLSDITQATGLTKGSIYGNFADKDEVALKAFGFMSTKRRRGLVSEMSPHRESPLAMLRAYASYFRGSYEVIREFGGCPIVNTAVDADDTNPTLSAAVRKVVEDWRTAMQDLIRRGVSLGEIKPETDPEERASLLISLLEGGLWLSKATGRREDLMRSLDHFERLLDEMAIVSELRQD